jgi:phosphoribosylaminoimidazole carboxylase PurE protein
MTGIASGSATTPASTGGPHAPSLRVGILMGSASDRPVMDEAALVLRSLQIGCEQRILSAHRTPAETDDYVRTAAERGVQVLICGAGLAAHLAGSVAGRTLLPVIGVPLDGALGGLDALLSTVQMPPGVPVATVAIGKVGAKNAGWLAARILALSDPALSERLGAAVSAMADQVRAADAALRDGG